VIENLKDVFIFVTHVKPEFQPGNSGSGNFGLESKFLENKSSIAFFQGLRESKGVRRGLKMSSYSRIVTGNLVFVKKRDILFNIVQFFNFLFGFRFIISIRSFSI